MGVPENVWQLPITVKERVHVHLANARFVPDTVWQNTMALPYVPDDIWHLLRPDASFEVLAEFQGVHTWRTLQADALIILYTI